MSADCVFCKIRDGAIPSAKLYEDERTFAIMDINPLNPGHCLVILKTHAPTLFDADAADLAAAITAASRVISMPCTIPSWARVVSHGSVGPGSRSAVKRSSATLVTKNRSAPARCCTI